MSSLEVLRFILTDFARVRSIGRLTPRLPSARIRVAKSLGLRWLEAGPVRFRKFSTLTCQASPSHGHPVAGLDVQMLHLGGGHMTPCLPIQATHSDLFSTQPYTRIPCRVQIPSVSFKLQPEGPSKRKLRIYTSSMVSSEAPFCAGFHLESSLQARTLW